MAVTKQRQRSVTSNYTPTHQAARPGRALRLAPVAVVGIGITVFSCTRPGIALATGIFNFFAFYAGVFSLVALSLTVMVGLLATDRLVLMVRHRILMQSVHRALATAAMVFLVIHILTKIAQGRADVADVLVPFLHHDRTLYVGLGTVAGYLMVAVMVTGIVRSRFAGGPRPWLWRALHATAYLCWPIALLHGLNAGRPAKPWVTTSYALCLILTGIALLIRVWVIWTRHLASPRTRTSAIQRPAHSGVGTAPRPTTIPAETSEWTRLVAHPVSSAPRGPIRPGASVSSSYRSTYASAAAGQPPPELHDRPPLERHDGPPPVGRWANTNTDTITDEEFWAYLREELRK